MATTKFELQQINTKLAADNLFLREQLSKMQTQIEAITERAARAEHSARRVIYTHNRTDPLRAKYHEARDAVVKTARAEGRNVSFPGFHAWVNQNSDSSKEA